MSNDILSFVGWTFLPDFVTNNLQFLYYKLSIRAGDPVPQPGSARHATHRRRIYIGVILCYLAYTLYEADWDIQRAGDFYRDIGVEHDVEEKAIQSRFRRLTLLYHPDKLPQSTTAEQRVMAEQRYVHLQLARDTLVDPVKRFAYDRFGPDVIQWKHCKTIKDFVFTGARRLIPFYIMSCVFMVVLGWMGFGDSGQYWRYLAIATLASLELHTITRPTFTALTRLPTLIPALIPSPSTAPFPLSLLVSAIDSTTSGALSSLASRKPYLPYQALRVAHRAIIAFFIALNRLGPVLSSSSSTAAAASDEDEGDSSAEALRKAVRRMEQTVGTSCAEAARLLGLELVPFRDREHESGGEAGTSTSITRGSNDASTVAGGNSGAGMRYLQEKVKEWFVTNTIRNDSEVQEAVGRVLERRRQRAMGEGDEGVGDA